MINTHEQILFALKIALGLCKLIMKQSRLSSVTKHFSSISIYIFHVLSRTQAFRLEVRAFLQLGIVKREKSLNYATITFS
jgi:hypothetical protein